MKYERTPVIYLKLRPDLSCEKICHHIQKLLNKYPSNGDKILKISLTEVNYDDHSSIPKLEYLPN